MRVVLTPFFELSNEHAASNYGQPVLVRRSTNEALRPDDIIQLYRDWPLLRANKAVERMARSSSKLTDEEREFVARFVNSGR
jgi:hypothetical protein